MINPASIRILASINVWALIETARKWNMRHASFILSHFLIGDKLEYFYFVINTETTSEKVVIAHEKRGNAEKYIKEAKCDMAVGHQLLQSF